MGISFWICPVLTGRPQTFVVIAGLNIKPGNPFRHAAGMRGYTYILASKKGGTLYCGVTSDLPGRWWEHQQGATGGFTARYGVKRLVWYEEFPWIIDAIKREKAIKSWPRKWKVDLIEETNPGWRDPSSHLVMF